SPQAAAFRHSRSRRPRSRSRRASFIPVRNGFDECLIVGFTRAVRDRERLPARGCAKRARLDVGHPDLDRAQPLFAQAVAVTLNLRANGLEMRCHHAIELRYM